MSILDWFKKKEPVVKVVVVEPVVVPVAPVVTPHIENMVPVVEKPVKKPDKPKDEVQEILEDVTKSMDELFQKIVTHLKNPDKEKKEKTTVEKFEHPLG